MALMEWTERFSVGVEQIDQEHQRLVALLNALFDAERSGRGELALGTILEGLMNYTETHFSTEERFMEEYSYPDLEAHRTEHRELRQSVHDVVKRHREGHTGTLALELMTLLRNWLVKHILGTDQLLGEFLVKQGVR